MSARPTPIDEALYEYLLSVSLREPDVMRRLRQQTQLLPEANMQIAPDQAQFMQMLVHLLGASQTIEVGVFTGYSALAVALALPETGRMVACEIEEKWPRIGQPYWKEAGVADKIDLRIAPARDTLTALLDEGGANSYDFAFIDADKEQYITYYELCLQLVRPGGLIAIDNTLWDGKVARPDNREPETEAIRNLNKHLLEDDRIELCLLTIADGLTLARKQ